MAQAGSFLDDLPTKGGDSTRRPAGGSFLDSLPAKQQMVPAQPASPNPLLAAGRGFVEGAGQGAKDLGIGVVKGVADIPASGLLLAPLINEMAASAYHRPQTDLTPSNEQLAKLEATNASQTIGKGEVLLAQLFGPKMLAALKGRGQDKAVLAAVEKATLASTQAAVTANSPGAPLPANPGSKAVLKGMKQGVRPGAKSPGSLNDVLTEALESLRTKPGASPVMAAEAAAPLTDDAGRVLGGWAGPERQVVESGLPKVVVSERRQGELLAKFGGRGPVAAAEKEAFFAKHFPPIQNATPVIKKAADTVAKTSVGPSIPVHLYKVVGPEIAAADASAATLIDAGKYDDAANEIEKGLEQFFKTVGEHPRTGSFSGQRGFSTVTAATSIAGGTVGAAGGAAYDEKHPVRGALVGGAVGALAPALIAHALINGLPATGKLLKSGTEKYLYTSILSSPTSVTKAYLGAVGGTISNAVEKLLAGDPSGAAVLRALFSKQAPQTFLAALKNPASSTLSGTATAGKSFDYLKRVYGAGDAVARFAMAAGGTGADEAARFTLSGSPTTALAKKLLDVWNRSFVLRLGTSMFPRVGLQILERGMERTPLAFANPALVSGTATKSLKAARAILGPAAGLLAYQGSDQVPGWAVPFVSALAGPYALLVGGGLAAGKIRDRGGDALAQYRGTAQEFAQSTPFPAYGPAESLDPGSLTALAVPNIVRDVARLTDPEHDRVTTGQAFGRLRAKVPGLREGLPVRGPAVNAEGKPIETRGLLQKLANARPQQNSPMKGVSATVKAELDRLSVSLSSPDYKRTIKVGQKELAIPASAAEQYQAESRQYLLPRLEKVIASDGYRRSDDARKKRLLEQARDAADRQGAGAARSRLIRLLRTQQRTP